MANEETAAVAAWLDEQNAAREQQNAARAEREANLRPTPTQRENDLAALGALDPLEPKEPDGAEPEAEAEARRLEERAAMLRASVAAPAGHEYVTRSAEAEETEGRRGRRRSAE